MNVRTTARVTRVLALVCAAGAVAGPALGQEKTAGAPTVPPAAEGEARPVEWRVEFFGGQQFKADLDRAGSVSAARAGGQLGVMVPVGEKDRLMLDLAAQGTFYSFKGATGLAASGDPVGTVEHFGISGRYFHRISEEWGAFAGAGVTSSGEPGAEFGKTVSAT